MQCTFPSLRVNHPSPSQGIECRHSTLLLGFVQNARSGLYVTRTFVQCKPNAAAQTTEIVANLSQDVKASWDECTALLMTIGFEHEDSNTVLVKAFGWGGQQYWRQEKVQEVPSVDQITGVLQVLDEFSVVSMADKATIIGKFPEVLGLPVDLIQSNFQKLQTQYFLKGPSLVAAVKRKPRVLGSIVDCQGSCEGYCTRCFVQF